jgi:cytochrome c oxidase assembly protein subunit 15
VTALVTLALIAVGGLVTSQEAGMAVPDWPNSYGYNMFLFPPSKWVGGILHEHRHRLLASFLGVLVVALTRWLGGKPSRLPLALIGVLEVVVGLALPRINPDLKAAGYFLSGIGSVVFLAAVVWVRNQPAATPLPVLGWLAFVGVQIQGLLGGLRVVLKQDEIGIFHAALAQGFFVLLCAIVVLTSHWWRSRALQTSLTEPRFRGAFAITLVIFVQLIIGATMRHQHAGLAIPDFPLAYGKLWPAMDEHSVALYNSNRMENSTVNSITAFQVALQMVHRIMALAILTCIAGSAWKAASRFGFKSVFTRWNLAWLSLVLLQASLGAATIWSNKAADVATAHVVVGALLLANGAVVCLIFPRSMLAVETRRAVALPAGAFPGQPVAAKT